MRINIRHRAACVFQVEKFTKDGVVYRGEPFSNLVLDVGLNNWAEGGLHQPYLENLTRRCNVGENATEPSPTQSGLISWLYSTNNLYGSITRGSVVDAPAHVWFSRTFEFEIGTVTGNLTEVGLSYASNANYFNRQLFRDSEDNPTTITVLENEGLRVITKVFVYVDLQVGESEAGEFILNEGEEDEATIAYTRYPSIGEGSGLLSTSISTYNNHFLPRKTLHAMRLALIPEVEFSGTTYSSGPVEPTGATTETYVANSFEVVRHFTWSPASYNDDINMILLAYAGGGAARNVWYKFALGTPITKLDVHEFKITAVLMVDRYDAYS